MLERLSGSVNQFFVQFLKLLEYPPAVMRCCGGSPDIIALDGIVMSIESKRIRAAKLSQPWISETNFNRQSTRKDRNVLELNAEEKNLITQYTSTNGVSVIDFDYFLSEYRRNPIVKLIQKSSTVTNGSYMWDDNLKPFFNSCRKDIMPAISFLPRMLWNAVDKYLENDLSIFDLVLPFT
jgi:hypothetical protein